MKNKDAQRLRHIAEACAGMDDQNLALLLAYAKGLEMGKVAGKTQQTKKGQNGGTP